MNPIDETPVRKVRVAKTKSVPSIIIPEVHEEIHEISEVKVKKPRKPREPKKVVEPSPVLVEIPVKKPRKPRVPKVDKEILVGEVPVKSKRIPSAYNLFVKEHMTKDDIKNLPSKERFSAISKLYQASKVPK